MIASGRQSRTWGRVSLGLAIPRWRGSQQTLVVELKMENILSTLIVFGGIYRSDFNSIIEKCIRLHNRGWSYKIVCCFYQIANLDWTIGILTGCFPITIFLSHSVITFWGPQEQLCTLELLCLDVSHMYYDRSEEAEIKHLHFYDVKYVLLGKCVSNKDVLAACFAFLN